ncbi:MAG: ATP-binding protein [Phenylobacterium sp.]|uniref:ATP-binding protein n=1 Tax=Phenylobacterium sp. TaxID=1871053 RepID=UPI003919778E
MLRSAFPKPWILSPLFAIGLAVALVLAGLTLAVFNEQQQRGQKLREVAVQADILAASVSAALAFDDHQAAQEYIAALRVNREIEAAGVYDAQGRLFAGFGLGAGPPQSAPAQIRAVDGDRLVATAPVQVGGAKVGSVYLRAFIEPIGRRAMRYAGIAFLVVMAALLVVVLGVSNASLAEAQRTLRSEAAEREKVEEALRQSQKMEAMGQLTGGVAHDFNNLLMVASSGVELMERTDDPKRQAMLRQGIRQAIERGASLTQQLLAFARRTPLDPQVVDLGERMGDTIALLDRSLRENVTVRLEKGPDLWPVEIDSAQFEVALLNIALNARDAMPGGGRIVIQVRNARDPAGLAPGDYVRLSVTDTGVGMPAELIPRAFEPFFTTKDVGMGTGLGLAQVYGFAKASGGDVRLESVPGEGATVSLFLPRTTKPLPPPPQAAAPIPERVEPARVLLVEDDDSVAEVVAQMLEELGYDARRAPNARTALNVLDEDAGFDLVLSDMIMPGDMNGLDLAHEISRRRPDLPVILTTGFSDAADAAAREGLRLLRKPYRMDALAAELAATLSAAPS